ncbi:mannosyltransferase family protein [Dokdonella soli]|uniref:Glycosyltransferase RgtA/B/C/D-like domain-containing protein n=1 Tax=Dokdonella soli TaxID=529810 RepID=A0ABP3TSL1_9GAMM
MSSVITAPLPAVRDLPVMDWLRSLRVALIAYAFSRGLILAVWVLSAQLHLDHPPGREQQAMPAAEIAPGALAQTLRNLALYNDGGWYLTIAEHGYETRPFDATRLANWAFFPLHPLLWRATAALVGDLPAAGLWLANLAFLAALVVLHRLALALGRDAAGSQRVVFALALFPVSYFCALPWSESLFLLLSAGAFLAAVRERWGWMALLGMLATATRLAGLFLLPALALWVWPRRHGLSARPWLALALIPLGLIAFMLELHVATGNALAFSGIQAAWGRHPTFPLEPILAIAQQPRLAIEDWNFRWLNLAVTLGGAAAVVALWRRREPALAVFLLLGLAAPLASGTLMSMARYALGLFPLALVIADLTADRAVERGWFALSTALLALMSAAFALGMTFAGA